VNAKLLILSSPLGGLTPLEIEFRELAPELGLTVIDGGDCSDLVQKIRYSAPNQVVVFAPAELLLSEMTLSSGIAPCPIMLISPVPQHGILDSLQEYGPIGWLPDTGLAAIALTTSLLHDRIRWANELSLRQELNCLQDKLNDRKWIDRAKGVLTRTRRFEEGEAFRLLRDAAMHSNLTIGQVSQSVAEASGWAEALNRAGQLRMLSQRVIKLVVQMAAGIDTHRARRLLDESEKRAQANLEYLSQSTQLRNADDALGSKLSATKAAWLNLKTAIAVKGVSGNLKAADGAANTLLRCAEDLVSSLELASKRSVLNIINLCGRQRMLVQRLTKEAWLMEMYSDAVEQKSLAQDFSENKFEFEAALVELDRNPASSREIRDALAATRKEWELLLHGFDSMNVSDGRLTASRASEALLVAFDDLTFSYERSMQVIMS